jgi:hypothetical protein
MMCGLWGYVRGQQIETSGAAQRIGIETPGGILKRLANSTSPDRQRDPIRYWPSRRVVSLDMSSLLPILAHVSKKSSQLFQIVPSRFTSCHRAA